MSVAVSGGSRDGPPGEDTYTTGQVVRILRITVLGARKDARWWMSPKEHSRKLQGGLPHENVSNHKRILSSHGHPGVTDV